MKKIPFKKVNYLVKSACGDCEKGEVIPAYLFLDGNDDQYKSIIYLPPESSKGYCGCLILCKQNLNGEYYEVCEEAYMNSPNLRTLKRNIAKL